MVMKVVEHERPAPARGTALGHDGHAGDLHVSLCCGGLGHAQVETHADVTGNLLWKLFLGMADRAMETEDGAYLERLKSAIEK